MTDTQQTLVLAALIAAAKTVQVMARRIRPFPPSPPSQMAMDSAEEMGRLKEQVKAIQEEVNRLRDWRHNEYVNDLNEWAEKFLTKREIEVMYRDSTEDRSRLWRAVEELRRQRI